jgi:hypothetical protein
MMFNRYYAELKTGIVNLKSGTAVRGVIYKRVGAHLIIKQATLLPQGTPMDGEILVTLADIDFVQILAE